MEPSEQEGAQGGAVCEDKQRINSVLFVVTVNGTHKLMNSDGNVIGTFTQRKSCVKLSVI